MFALLLGASLGETCPDESGNRKTDPGRNWITPIELRPDDETRKEPERQPSKLECSRHRFTNLDNYNLCYDRPRTSSVYGNVTF